MSAVVPSSLDVIGTTDTKGVSKKQNDHTGATMILKNGVQMNGLSITMRPALIEAERIYKLYGKELVVTSALDSTHSAGSLHYYGYALDLRTSYFTAENAEIVSEELAYVLHQYDPAFRVVLEHNHIHVEHRAIIDG